MDGNGNLLTASSQEVSLRLDQFLTKRFPEQSRTYFQGLIDEGLVLVNGRAAKKRSRLEEGDEVSVTFADRPFSDLKPEPFPAQSPCWLSFCCVNSRLGLLLLGHYS